MRFAILTVLMTLTLLASEGINLPQKSTVSFTQFVTNPKGAKLSYSGILSIYDLKFMIWDYKKPTKKRICMLDKKVMIIDYDLEQVSYYLIDDRLDIAKVLSGAKRHSNNIYLATFDSKQYTMRTNGEGALESLAYFDKMDNKIQIGFNGYKKGILGDIKSQCIVPKGYDEIGGFGG